jgi:allophanate hydrolase subunit 2
MRTKSPPRPVTKGERLRVTGTVVSIDRAYEGRPVLHLFGGSTIFPTMATLNQADIPAAAQLKKGDQVVVRCIGAGGKCGCRSWRYV